MRVIKLYGELGRRFGKRFELDVKTAAEAVRALCILVDGFEKFLFDSGPRGMGFKVIDGTYPLSEDELRRHGSSPIKIVPVIGGANAEARILIGATLIAAGALMTATGVGAAVSPYVMNAGIALAMGGVIEMIVGKPEVPKMKESPGNNPSYVFSGAVNTTAQGHPVPIGYGRMIVGSAVISASLSTAQLMSGYVRVARVTEWGSYLLKPANAYKTETRIVGSTYSSYLGANIPIVEYRYFYWSDELRPV